MQLWDQFKGKFKSAWQTFVPPKVMGNKGNPPPAKSLVGDILKTEKIMSALYSGAIQNKFYPLSESLTNETPEMRAAYLEMLRDPYLKQAVLTKVLAVAALEPQVNPDSETEADKTAADFIRYNYAKIAGGAPHMVWNIALPAILTGYSVSEKVYEPITRGKWRGKWRIKALKSKDVRYIELMGDAYKNITSIRDMRTNTVYHVGNFVVYQHMPIYENPTGMSDLRSAYRAFWLIDTAWQLRAIAAERYGLPAIVGKYEKGDDTTKTGLETQLPQLRSMSWAVIPVEAQIEALDISARGQSDYDSMVNSLREEMVLSVTGAVLQMLQGQVSDGRGNSKVHQTTAALLQWFLAAEIGHVLDDQLTPDLIDLNFPLESDYPTTTFGGLDDAELKSALDIDDGLVNKLGVKLSLKDRMKFYGRQAPLDENDEIKKAEPPQQPQPFSEQEPEANPQDEAKVGIEKSKALAALQEKFTKQEISRGGAIANAVLTLGIDEANAAKLFPEPGKVNAPVVAANPDAVAAKMPIEAKVETPKISRWGKVQKVLDGLKGFEQFCREGVNAGKPGPCPQKDGEKLSRKERRRQRKEKAAAEQEAKRKEPEKVEIEVPSVQPVAVNPSPEVQSRLAAASSFVGSKLKGGVGWLVGQVAEMPIVKQTFAKVAEGDKVGAAKAFGKEAGKMAADYASSSAILFSTSLWSRMAKDHGKPAAVVASAAYALLSVPASAVPLGRTAVFYGITGAADFLKKNGGKIVEEMGKIPAGMAGFAEAKEDSIDLLAVVGLVQASAKAMAEKFGDKAPTWTDDEVAEAVLKVLGADGSEVPGVEKQAEDPREFASTQFNLENGTYDRDQGSPMPAIFAMAERIKEEDLVEDGLEEEHHITIKFGLHADDPEEVRQVVAGFGPVKVRLGKTSIFAGDEQDVVKIDVGGDDLLRLNQLICDSLECTDTHPEYKPHVTLAYVKPGMGKKYVGWDGAQGKVVNFSGLVFSGKDRAKTVISLVEDEGGEGGDDPEPDAKFCREGRNAGKPGPCPKEKNEETIAERIRGLKEGVDSLTIDRNRQSALLNATGTFEEMLNKKTEPFRKRINEAYSLLKDKEASKAISLLDSSVLKSENFKPVKNNEEAERFAKESLGIGKLTIDTDNLAIVNSVLGGLLAMKERSGSGMPSSLEISKSKDGADGSYRAGIGSLIGAGAGTMKIDVSALEHEQKMAHEKIVREKYSDVFKSNPDPIYTRRGVEGFLSSTDPLSVIAHEYGHFRHMETGLAKSRFEIGLNLAGAAASVALPPVGAVLGVRNLYNGIKNWADWRSCRKGQAGKVSGYAMTSPSEFVAEVYAGTATGKKYGKDTMDWFAHFGGKHP